MRLLGESVVALTLLALTASLGRANCAADDPDGSKTLAARQQAATDCSCDQSDPPAVNHGQYVKCVAGVAQARSELDPADPSFLPKSCKGAVKKCAAHSTCGKPGFVTCCITNDKGVTKCKTKKDEMHCTDKQGVVGTCTSCCDACPAPGSGPSCSTQTTTTTTTAQTTTTTFILCHLNSSTFLCEGGCAPGDTCGTLGGFGGGGVGDCQCFPPTEACQPGPGLCNNRGCPGPSASQVCDINPADGNCECYEPCGSNPLTCSGTCPEPFKVCAGPAGACFCCVPPGGPCFAGSDCCSGTCNGSSCQ